MKRLIDTSDIGRAFRRMGRLEAGSIGVNDGVPTAIQCPFGGVKQIAGSSKLGEEGLEAFLEMRHVSLAL